MKIKIDLKEILELTETQKRVLKHDIDEDIFDADIERRVQYIITHKYEQVFKRLKEEWEPKLKANGVESVPLNEAAFAELVFAQPNYKGRKAREDEANSAKAALEANKE